MVSERDEWRAELVEKYGESAVAAMEEPNPNPEGCLDSMDGRHWCRTHDAPWPLRSGNRCSAVLTVTVTDTEPSVELPRVGQSEGK